MNGIPVLWMRLWCDLPEIRKRYINRFIAEENYGKAKELCKEGIEMNKEWAGVVTEWKDFLKKIEKIEGKEKAK